MTAVLALALTACSPKLGGARCVTDTNCPKEQTCFIASGLVGGVCQQRPTCKEDCAGEHLVCGFANGAPACQCPANDFVDGGFVLLVSTQGTLVTGSGPRPNGASSPVTCSFRTLSDALDLANAMGDLDAGFPITVAAAQNNPVFYVKDERFPLTVRSGVRLLGSLDSKNLTTIVSGKFRHLVKLLPGGTIDSFLVSSSVTDGDPMVVAACPNPGGPSTASNLVVVQPADAGTGADAGAFNPGLDAGANTGLEVQGPCALNASSIIVATEGYGVGSIYPGATLAIENGSVSGKAAGMWVTDGTVSAKGVAIQAPSFGVVIEPRSVVSFSLTDAGISAPFGIAVAVPTDAGVNPNQVSVSVKSSSILLTGVGVFTSGADVTLEAVEVTGGASAQFGLYADGPSSSLQAKNVHVSHFSAPGSYGLFLSNGAEATLSGGQFDQNDVAVQTVADAGVDATGTMFTQSGLEGVVVSGGVAKFHGVTVSNADGGVARIGVSANGGGALTLDGPSVVSGFAQGLHASQSTVVLKGNSAAAPVQLQNNGQGLIVVDSALDATFAAITGRDSSSTQVQINNSNGGVGQPVSFDQCAFNGIAPSAPSTSPASSFVVYAAYPLPSGVNSLSITNSKFTGGERGLELGSMTSSSGAVVYAALTGNEFSNFTDRALLVNGAQYPVTTSGPGSNITLDGNSLHGNNTLGAAAGGLVFANRMPPVFVFQGNKIYKNQNAQLAFDVTAQGLWTLEGGSGSSNPCAVANQIACYVKGQGLVATAPPNGVQVQVRNNSWTNATPNGLSDYTVTGPSSITASPSCAASTVVCN